MYLPNDYAISTRHYPVLYMQDGQNLFDLKSSFSGEWEIDEYLDSIDFAGIVIGIDNGGETRINEYNPNDTEAFGKGLGREYLDRIVKILKPYIDKQFRTLADRDHTSVAGSSMGGLIAFYAGLYHPKVFGSVGVFSPSFWLVKNIEEQAKTVRSKFYRGQRYYFYGGGKEGENLVESLQSMAVLLQSKHHCLTTVSINEKGTHSESNWRKIFPSFYTWLMKA